MHAAHKVKSSDISELELLRLIRARQADPRLPTPDVALADRFPAKVVLAKMVKLCGRDLIDYGVSLRTAYLTEKGKARLAELEGQAT
jgi:hypothetical protein